MLSAGRRSSTSDLQEQYLSDLQRLEGAGLLRAGTVVAADNVVLFKVCRLHGKVKKLINTSKQAAQVGSALVWWVGVQCQLLAVPQSQAPPPPPSLPPAPPTHTRARARVPSPTISVPSPRTQLDNYLNHVRTSGRYSTSRLHEGHVEYDRERLDGVEVSVYAG